MSKNHTSITGLGAISASGSDIPRTLASFEDNAPLTCPRRATGFATEIGKPVFEVEIPNSVLPDNIDFPSRTAELTTAAVREALHNAGDPHTNPNLRIGVCLGTTVACQLNSLDFYRKYRETSSPPLEPVRTFLNGNLAEFIAELYNLEGPRTTVVNACSSGTDAIGAGLSWIRAGLCDLVIAGGADELNRAPLAGFNSLGIMSDQPCRPFDGERTGLNLGEGAGIMILENSECAASRGRRPGLSLTGYGTACDAYHMTAPRPDGLGLKLAIRQALAQAELATEDIAFVNAHGTATVDNDRVEGRVLAEIFGRSIPFYSTKGRTGHTLGAAGGLEAVFTALGLEAEWIPASVGFAKPDPDIPGKPVTRKTEIKGAAALSTSLAFGGNNSAVIIRKQS